MLAWVRFGLSCDLDKDWSGTSPNRTGPPKLVGSSHRHQPGRASLVLPPRLDRSDYSEPWVDPNKPDDYNKTPLLHAAQNGQAEVVKILLGRGEVNPNEPDDHGNTALSQAASWGHENVVRILLGGRGVGPGGQDNGSQTPLLLEAVTQDPLSGPGVTTP